MSSFSLLSGFLEHNIMFYIYSPCQEEVVLPLGPGKPGRPLLPGVPGSPLSTNSDRKGTPGKPGGPGYPLSPTGVDTDAC